MLTTATQLISAILLASALSCAAQTASPPQSPATPPPPAQKPAPVTTTVVVHGQTADDYLPAEVSLGNLTGLPLASAPVSATVITRDLLTDQFSRTLADVVKNDASIGEDYAPVGYYGDYQIRGFTIDLATGLQINGLTIAGEQDVQLENKQQVEILKGIAALDTVVTSAGGLINFVSKRPAVVKSLDFATDHRGTSFGSLDLGTLFGAARQFGARVNLTGEDIHTYVNHADGVRGAAAFAGDWKLRPNTTLSSDFEYQHRVQHSVAGYQLLGGATLPDPVYPSTMLGDQPWSKPNTFDTVNASLRLDSALGPASSQLDPSAGNWHLSAAAGFSQSLIDDNVIYPYGAAYDPVTGNQLCSTPYWFFCPDGSYEIYDYRDPGELRIDTQADAVAQGRVKTGPFTHHLSLGGELFRRSVNLPGTPPANAPSTVQDGAVYAAFGVENVYQNNIVYPDSTADLTAGPVQLSEDNHQSALLLQDRLTLPAGFQLIAGGRLDSLRDHNYGQPKLTSNDPAAPETVELVTHQLLWLPQYAASWSHSNLTVYANYSVMLSLGPQAPFWAGSYYLPPFFTRQAEIGAKYEPSHRILLTGALFRMRAPFYYPKVITLAFDPACTDAALNAPGNQCFVSEGRETHNGVEIGAEGRAASWLRLTASAAAIHAFANDTGTPSFDGKQVINQPRIKTTAFADIAVPARASLHLADFHLLPGWSYSARKAATRDDLVSVPGYNLFSLGARYTPGGEQGRVSFRLFADNILDKRYWKDTGASYGDTFIHLGAPTTVRLAMHYQF